MSVLGSAMLPPLLVIPVAALAMGVIATHVVGLHLSTTIPPRRRRIRTANGLLMLLLTALLAYALGVEPEPLTGAGSHSARSFLMVWLIILALLAMVMALAAMDAAHTLLLGLAERRVVRRVMTRASPGSTESAMSPASGEGSGSV